MPKNKKTYYQLILDKSGSMSDCVQSTINGFNEQMQMIRSMKKKFPEQEFVVSLTTFNHEIDFDIDMQDPDNVKELVSAYDNNSWLIENNKIIYETSGMTALYDAIGMSVKKIQKQAKKEIAEDLATAVVVIITDGHENSSERYTYKKIQSMIKELEQSDNWTFSYLSNTPDAVEYAEKMNIKKENAIMYCKETVDHDYNDIVMSMDKYFSLKQDDVKEKKFIKSRRM